MKKLFFLLFLFSWVGCASNSKLHLMPMSSELTANAVEKICIRVVPKDAIVTVGSAKYRQLPLEKEVWDFTNIVEEKDIRHKYVDPQGKVYKNICGLVSSEYAEYMGEKTKWPVGEAYDGNHWINCCVTRDKGLVYFDPMESGIIGFFPKIVLVK